MNNNFPQIAVVILAAGASRRFGRPKQLEIWPYESKQTFVEHTVNLAYDAGIKPIYIVTGNKHEEVAALFRESTVHIVYNQDWQAGQGYSVATGVKAIQTKESQVKAILFMLVDQPRLKPTTLTTLLYQGQNSGRLEHAIIVPTYESKRGNPVIFGRDYWTELSQLEGDVGGRDIIKKHQNAVVEVVVDDPTIHEDVDTPTDLEKII